MLLVHCAPNCTWTHPYDGNLLMCRHGMEPHVTIIWFVLPQWFQEMGAFLKEENIALAVDWAETAFKLFGEACSSDERM